MQKPRSYVAVSILFHLLASSLPSSSPPPHDRSLLHDYGQSDSTKPVINANYACSKLINRSVISSVSFEYDLLDLVPRMLEIHVTL